MLLLLLLLPLQMINNNVIRLPVVTARFCSPSCMLLSTGSAIDVLPTDRPTAIRRLYKSIWLIKHYSLANCHFGRMLTSLAHYSTIRVQLLAH